MLELYISLDPSQYPKGFRTSPGRDLLCKHQAKIYEILSGKAYFIYVPLRLHCSYLSYGLFITPEAVKRFPSLISDQYESASQDQITRV